MPVGQSVIVALVIRQAVAVHLRQETQWSGNEKSQTRSETASRNARSSACRRAGDGVRRIQGQRSGILARLPGRAGRKSRRAGSGS